MRRRRWCSVVLAWLCVFSVATSAAAECAWGLWYRSESVSPRERSDWGNLGFYPTYSKCWAKIRKDTEIAEEGSWGDWSDWMRGIGRYRKVSVEKGSLFHPHPIATEDGVIKWVTANDVAEYKCLPASVDPRGPNGK